MGAARLINRHGPIEDFPPEALGPEHRRLALLFKDLATLRDGEQLFAAADDLRWRGPTAAFPAAVELLDDARLAGRVEAAHAGLSA